ncbi:MAG TPA: hypothetical protein VIL77_08690 [Gaiellaceae bacterium]
MTPTLSLEAAHDSVTAGVPIPLAANAAGRVGGVPSGHPPVVTDVVVAADAFPAASSAATPSV